MRRLLLRASGSEWLRERATRYGFARRTVHRFMPGEDLDAALAAAHALKQRGLAVVLTQLGEDLGAASEADAVRDHYREVLERLAASELDGQISVKPTQLGLGLDLDRCHSNLRALAAKAADVGNFLWVDMEGSAHTEATLTLYRRLREEHDNVGLCIQSYLYRSPRDLEELLPLRPAIRLVKGAYRESSEVAFPRRKDVNRAYLLLAERLLRAAADGQAVRPAWGTHDLAMLERIAVVADRFGIGRSEYEVQMLYGIRTHAQERLAGEGYRVRTLISYGEAWYPWFVRRLAERPANLAFVVRNLVSRR